MAEDERNEFPPRRPPLGWPNGGFGVPSVDALTFLREAHREVQDLFEDFRDAAESGTTEVDRDALGARICSMLELHAQLEEELFYAVVRSAIARHRLLDEAQVEHAVALHLIAQVRASEPGSAQFDASVNVLGEYVQHHIREEEDELFALVESSELDIDELGAALDARRAELERFIDPR